MSGMTIGLLIFGGLLVLLAMRIHVGTGMLIGGSAGFLAMNGGDPSSLLFTLNHLAYARLSNYDLAVIPLFMLMGQFATHGGLSRSLFRFAAAFMGHWRGGLAMAPGRLGGASVAVGCGTFPPVGDTLRRTGARGARRR